MAEDKHVIETLGCARVTIQNGEIAEVGEPQIDNCPIFERGHKIKKFNKENIRKNINFRIDHFGYCTKNREVSQEDTLVAVGLSEILSTAVANGKIDCVVGACDGVGTLLMTDPAIVEGVGGRVSALVSTSPIPEVIEKVGVENVIFPDTADLDPIKGLDLAIERGYKNIGITIIPSSLIKEIREYPIPDDVNVYLFIAHTTGVSYEEAAEIFNNADIITACASKYIRQCAEELEVNYYGKIVSIYVPTEKGIEFLDDRLKLLDKPLSTNNYPQDGSMFPSPLK